MFASRFTERIVTLPSSNIEPTLKAKGIQANEGGDPSMTTNQLENATFVKPEIMLPSALRHTDSGQPAGTHR
jgi:hypothetical protein